MDIVFETIKSLLKEHQEEYKHFTRLLLTLSVGFITFITAIKSGEADLYSIYQKAGVILHCLSILFGVWLQFILVTSPLKDIEIYIDRIKSRTEKEKAYGGFVDRPVPMYQRAIFVLQAICFVLAFFLVVINVLYEA